MVINVCCSPYPLRGELIDAMLPAASGTYGKGTDACQSKVQVANLVVSNSDSSSPVDAHI